MPETGYLFYLSLISPPVCFLCFLESQGLTDHEGMISLLLLPLKHSRKCRSRSSPQLMTLRLLAVYTPISWRWCCLPLQALVGFLWVFFLTNTRFIDRDMLPFKLLPSSKVHFLLPFDVTLGCSYLQNGHKVDWMVTRYSTILSILWTQTGFPHIF